MAMEMVQRSFGRNPRNSAVGVDQSESVPLTPSARNYGIGSAEGPERWESSPPGFPRTGYAYDDTTHVRVRSRLSPAEESHWKKAEKYVCLGKGRLGGLEVFPKFFSNYAEAGLELKEGLYNIWSTFVIAESLLISIAITPLVTYIPNLGGWKLKVYGGFWMLVIVSDVMSFAVTALFLGYLHSYPGKLTYMWLCHIGQWASLPSMLVLLATFITLGAINFTSWVIYGREVGIICAGTEALVLIFLVYTFSSLAKAGKAMEALD